MRQVVDGTRMRTIDDLQADQREGLDGGPELYPGYLTRYLSRAAAVTVMKQSAVHTGPACHCELPPAGDADPP
jgi:hypothetical protein